MSDEFQNQIARIKISAFPSLLSTYLYLYRLQREFEASIHLRSPARLGVVCFFRKVGLRQQSLCSGYFALAQPGRRSPVGLSMVGPPETESSRNTCPRDIRMVNPYGPPPRGLMGQFLALLRTHHTTQGWAPELVP